MQDSWFSLENHLIVVVLNFSKNDKLHILVGVIIVLAEYYTKEG